MLTILRNALLGLCVLGSAGTALAQDPEAGDFEPIEDEEASSGGSAELGGGGGTPFSAGLLLGGGIGFDEVNAWGIGLGVRGGYNLEAANLPEVYLGARFLYYFGEEFAPGLSISHWELGIEGGYEIPVGPVVIRPQLGFGLAMVTVDFEASDFVVNDNGGSESEGYLYIALGGSVLYDIDEQFFVGGELALNFVLSDPEGYEGLTILANGGMRF